MFDPRNVKAEMGRRGVNRGQLARLTGLTGNTITAILRGQDTRVSNVERIAVALDVPEATFFVPGVRSALRDEPA